MFHLPQQSTTFSNYLQRPRSVSRTRRRKKVLAPPGFYRTAEVSRLAGVSERQLQWWDEQGVLSPSQQGHMRIYSQDELRWVRMVVALRSKGISLRECRYALKLKPLPGVIVGFRRTWKRFTEYSDALEFAINAKHPVVLVVLK